MNPRIPSALRKPSTSHLPSGAAFTLVEIMIVVAIIGVIAAIAFPNYFTIGTVSKKTVCIQNMKQLDAAIDQWALENNIAGGTEPTDAIYDYVKNTERPSCPSGGEYVFSPVGTSPQVTCSLGASEGHTLPE